MTLGKTVFTKRRRYSRVCALCERGFVLRAYKRPRTIIRCPQCAGYPHRYKFVRWLREEVI